MSSRSPYWPWLLAGVAALLALAILVRFVAPEAAYAELRRTVETAGPAGPLVFAAVYIVLVLLLVPGSLLGIAGGALYGMPLGFLVVWPTATVAAALAFLTARHLARGKVERLARRYPAFAAVDAAIADGGWRIIGLLRLSPVVPYSAGNYLFGLTRARFAPYLLASALFTAPGTLVYAWLGATFSELAFRDRLRRPEEWALLGVGLLATAAAAIHLTRLARRRLAETPARPERDEEP